MAETTGVAYLREFETTNQCELMFPLKVELKNVGLLVEDVRAVRQLTDTVESLMQHIVNKIKKTVKEKTSNEDDREVEIFIALRNSITQKPIKPKMILKNLINANMKEMEFQIFDQRYIVVINAPLVRELKLPLIVYANFTVQPSRLYCLFADNGSCKYSWFKSKDKENWIQVANTQKYKVTDDDVDHYLKLECVPCNTVLTGPSAEVISENKVEIIKNLPECPFEKRHKFTTDQLKDKCFRIVSYNVLSNRYTENSDTVPHCSPKFLAIDYRKQLIAKELRGYQADILCLQEVDTSVYASYYKDIFKDKGYIGYYHRKGNKISEGLACFFNKSRFKKVDDHQIIYSNEINRQKLFTYLWNFVKVNSDLKECFMRQMTSLHITVLKMKTSKKSHCIIIGNTHLFYHPAAELVRIIQINMATTYLQYLNRVYSQTNSVKVILCGDFNSVPTSAIFEYVIQGKISKTHPVFDNTSNSLELFHRFNFESACGVPKYTNYTYDFKDCLDYIFIEKDKMKVNQVVPFPTEEELAVYSNEGLPNEVYPSDHLALVVDLELVS